MESRNLFWEVAFASLLHDIGKFYMRSSRVRNAFTDISRKHPAYAILISEVLANQFSACKLDVHTIALLARHHHETADFEELVVEAIPEKNLKVYAQIISEADNISSGERYAGEDRVSEPYERVQYESIFSFIAKDLNNPEKISYIRADRLDRDIEVSYGEIKGYTDYDSLVGEFNKNASRIEIPDVQDIETKRWAFFISLLSLLRFYTFFVPSDVTRRKDVSLYDHLKTTSAIATCLYLWHISKGSLERTAIKDREEKKFLLIAGETGSIQNFISSVRNVPDEGGVAKRLRARSFKINALSVAVASQLAKRLGLTYASVVYNTGGKFLMLAPNTEEVLQTLESYRLELSKALVEEYGALFSLNLAWIEASASDLMLGERKSNCTETLRRLESVLASEKYRPLNAYLVDGQRWLDGRFVLKGKWEEGEYCAVCESFPGALNEREVRVCRFCEEEKLLGGRLLGRSYALITERSDADYKLFGKLKVDLTEKVDFSSEDIIAINIENEVLEDLLRDGVEFPPGLDLRFSPYYAPEYRADTISEGEVHPRGSIVTFESLANLSRGDKSLGVLKADVDRLGFILSSCFPNMSISRLSTFSFLLDYFFSFRFLNVIKRDFPETYIVYAGGDDLFCLGPWDSIVKMVPRLKKEFFDWVGQNPLFSISSGVTVIDRRVPFSEISKIVSEELKNAKSLRGSASVFGLRLSYEELEEAFNLSEEISNLMQEPDGSPTVSRSTLQKLVDIYKEWEEYKKVSSESFGGPLTLPLFAPHLAYVIYREDAFRDESRLHSSMKKLLALLRQATRPSVADSLMPKIGVFSTLVLLMTRKET